MTGVPVALWLALVVPSLDIVEKVAGVTGLVVYVPLSIGLLRVVPRLRLPRSRRMLTAGTLGVLVLAFALLHPIANAQTPGRGSNDDDAYNVGARALMRLESPYARRAPI